MKADYISCKSTIFQMTPKLASFTNYNLLVLYNLYYQLTLQMTLHAQIIDSISNDTVNCALRYMY